jgi:hypothetical protein
LTDQLEAKESAMKKCNVHYSVLLAGLLAVAGVQAQSTPAAGSSDGPPKAGEASTQTRGVPNAATTNSPVGDAPVQSRDEVRQDAHGMSGAAVTTPVPGKAGEASTMVQGRPNASDASVMGAPKARDEVRSELLTRRQVFEAERRAHTRSDDYRVSVGTPATLPADSLSVFEGGTPQ